MAAGIDALAHRVRPSAAEPEGALVLLHGRGADENDLFPLLDLLDPARRLVGVTPRAPLALPPGGAHWYIVREVGYPDRQTFDAGFELAAGWLDSLPDALGFPRERMVIGGFSQGAVMSLALGLGVGRPSPAAIVALSGFIPTVEGFQLDLAARDGLPVAIGHGTQDPVIGIELGRNARRTLEKTGVDLVYRESPMGHSIDPRFVQELGPWVISAMEAAASAA